MSPLQRLHAFLFAPQRDWVAPVMRVVVVAAMFPGRILGAAQRLKNAFGEHPLEVVHAPHVEAVLRHLHAWPPSRGFVDALAAVLVVAGVCALVGLFTRVALFTCFALLTVEYGVVSGLGFFNHTPALPTQILLALALLPGSTAWSVDRALLWAWRRRRGVAASLRDVLHPLVPRFGEVGLCVVVGVFYFTSGLSKVRLGLPGWIDGSTLAYYFGGTTAQEWYGPVAHSFAHGAGAPVVDGYLYMAAPTWLSRFFAAHPVLVVPMSWATVLFELATLPLLLWSTRTRVAVVVVAIAFHLLVLATLGPDFIPWIVVDACLLAPAVIDVRARRRSRGLSRSGGAGPTPQR